MHENLWGKTLVYSCWLHCGIRFSSELRTQLLTAFAVPWKGGLVGRLNTIVGYMFSCGVSLPANGQWAKRNVSYSFWTLIFSSMWWCTDFLISTGINWWLHYVCQHDSSCCYIQITFWISSEGLTNYSSSSKGLMYHLSWIVWEVCVE